LVWDPTFICLEVIPLLLLLVTRCHITPDFACLVYMVCGSGVTAVTVHHDARRSPGTPLEKSRILARRTKNREQRAEGREQRAESKEQRAESREQRAESREQRVEKREQRAEIREQRSESARKVGPTQAEHLLAF
jgi:hypothetical protein